MELWLLAAGAIVLIVITLWLVWPAASVEPVGAVVRGEEDTTMMPQGDQFEDQYTSATADLSAGGVAASMSADDARAAAPPTPAPTPYGAAGEPWSSPTLAHGATAPTPPTPPTPKWEPPTSSRWEWSTEHAHGRWATRTTPRTIGMGAAAMLTISGAIAGAWLYARWRRRRDEPLNRLRRGLYEARDQFR